MHKKKRFFRIILSAGILLFIIIVIFFISKNELQKRPVHIALVIKTIDPSYEFWQIVIAGTESACSEEGAILNVYGPQLENDVDSQIEIINNIIPLKPSALILAACDYNRLVPVVNKIDENQIPLIVIDSGINSDIPLSLIATDNIAAGEKAGLKMLELLSAGDHVIIMSYVKGTATAKVLKENPGIKGIIALNDPTTIGVARILKQYNFEDKIQLVGFDNSLEEIDYLEEGIIKALIVQKPFNMGYLSAKAAINSIRGKKVQKRIDTSAGLITSENMYSEENQKLLFPII